MKKLETVQRNLMLKALEQILPIRWMEENWGK